MIKNIIEKSQQTYCQRNLFVLISITESLKKAIIKKALTEIVPTKKS